MTYVTSIEVLSDIEQYEVGNKDLDENDS